LIFDLGGRLFFFKLDGVPSDLHFIWKYKIR